MTRDELLRALGVHREPTVAEQILPALGIFGTGVLVGASISLLLAPKSGRELRGDIGRGAGRLRRRAGEATSNVSEKVSEGMSTASEKVGETASTVKDKVGSRVSSVRDRVQAWRSSDSSEGESTDGMNHAQRAEVEVEEVQAG